MKIPFNRPFLVGKEVHYIYDAVHQEGKLSGNGKYTKFCQDFFERRFGFGKCLLTTSCTDALEMAAILLNIQPGDEVIMPSYTFVSTANAFVLRGARIRFVDSRPDHPGMDEDLIEDLVNERTKAIVPVHYAGVACDMEKVLDIARKYNLYVVEDAAQAIEGFYTFSDGTRKPLGSIGDLAAFSFHETKNIISGEGGMLVVNNPEFLDRAEIIWEKGTNRAAFWRGEVDKYGWVDVGSSFLPSEIIAAFLWAQLECLDDIQQTRLRHWDAYFNGLKFLEEKGVARLPVIPEYATNNAHMFYLVCRDGPTRDEFIKRLAQKGIKAVFHYLSLHNSQYYREKHDGRKLPICEYYSDTLVRLPMFYELDVHKVIAAVKEICKGF